MANSFAVVHFLKYNEVEVAPTNWISKQGETHTCMWPNIRNPEKIRAAIKKRISPDKATWESWDIRLKQEFRTFEEASCRVKHFEDHSEMSEMEKNPPNVEKVSRSGRHLKRRHFQCESNSQSDDHQNGAASINNIPSFPVFIADDDINNVSEETVPPVVEPLPQASSDKGYTEMFVPFAESGFSSQFAAQFREFQNVCFRNFATLQANQSSMLKMMEAVLYNTKASGLQLPVTVCGRPNFGFPFKDIDKLLEFDQKLGLDESLRSACVKYLGSIGGSDLTTAVFEPLKKIITYELAYNFNFTGKNGKANFSSLNLNDLIFDLVQLNPNTSQASLISVKSKIQKWVQHVGDKLTKEQKALISTMQEFPEDDDS